MNKFPRILMIDFWNAMNQKSMMTNKISIDQLFQNEFLQVINLKTEK